MDDLTKAKVESVTALSGGKLNDFVLSETFITLYENTGIFCKSWNEFLLYEGKYYKRMTKTDLMRKLVEIVQEFFPDQTKKITASMLDAVHKLISIRFPKQLEDDELDHQYFAFSDGLYNTYTHEKEPFSPKILCFKYVDVAMADFEKPAPTLERYIQTTLVDIEGNHDESLAMLYQEMIGSIFSSQQSANRAFFLYGQGSNGKSKTTELILSLFEDQYKSAANLETLSQTFGKARLVGKVVNIPSEEESQFIKADVFKALVTGEAIDARRLYENHFSYQNFAKLIFPTNAYPKFGGLDRALQRRIIIIPFNKNFKGNEIDHDIDKKLATERAQFVWFGLQGLKRLQENNYIYTKNKQSSDSLMELQEESSSVARYISEEVEFDKSRTIEPIEAKELYSDYKDWCRQNGHQAVASSRFSREMSTIDIAQEHMEKKRNLNLYYIFNPAQILPPVIPPTSPLI